MFDRRITMASMAAFVAMAILLGARGTVVAADAADADSPAAVMTAFFTAVEKGDYPAATALLSAKGKEKTTEERLKQLNQTLKGGFTVGEAELQGDTAKVKCSVPKKRKATSFYLVKEGGKWLFQGN
ncbi:MAG: hypothetical protein ACAI43_04875 [Phycisphaerae bacterium]|nr:hypothetical protein [Tepidisphaeraceae bacterium]